MNQIQSSGSLPVPSKRVAQHASRWIIYYSVLDGSAYNWVLLENKEITAYSTVNIWGFVVQFSGLVYRTQSTTGVDVPFLIMAIPATEPWSHEVNWSPMPLCSLLLLLVQNSWKACVLIVIVCAAASGLQTLFILIFLIKCMCGGMGSGSFL